MVAAQTFLQSVAADVVVCLHCNLHALAYRREPYPYPRSFQWQLLCHCLRLRLLLLLHEVRIRNLILMQPEFRTRMGPSWSRICRNCTARQSLTRISLPVEGCVQLQSNVHVNLRGFEGFLWSLIR